MYIKLYSCFFPVFVWFALNYRNELQAFLSLASLLFFLSKQMFSKNSLSNYLAIFWRAYPFSNFCITACFAAQAIHITKKEKENTMDTLALILVIIGALNWGMVGLFQFDLIASIFGGMSTVVSRIIYTIVGLAGIWGISILFRRDGIRHSDENE